MAASESSISPTLPQPAFSHTIAVKLTPDNYLLWKTQLVPYLHGNRLYKYVDGSHPAPTPMLSNKNPNPEYALWFQQDQQVISTLISSLSEPLMGQVVGCSSARAVWLSLESTYASVSQARVIQTQFQLASLKKGADTISTYFRKAKGLADVLTAAGRPLPPAEFVPYLLAGLGPDYDGLVTSVTTRLDPISPEELLGL